MKILVTNDDGISSKLILLLYKELNKRGYDTTICAPDKNNSCISESIRFWEYSKNKLTKIDNNIYTHPGTPADGINYYLKEFNKPDLVISGINLGLNGGVDVQYSGTIGAASEAINCDIPAIAISADVNCSEDTVLKGLCIILDKVFSNNLYTKDFIYSFNIPQEIRCDKIIVAPLNRGLDINENSIIDINNYPSLDTHYYSGNVGKNTDIFYLYKGIMTVTPVLVDRTDYQNMAKIANFFDK